MRQGDRWWRQGILRSWGGTGTCGRLDTDPERGRGADGVLNALFHFALPLSAEVWVGAAGHGRGVPACRKGPELGIRSVTGWTETCN